MDKQRPCETEETTRVETWKQETAWHIWETRSGCMRQRAGHLKEVPSGTEVWLGMLGRVPKALFGTLFLLAPGPSFQSSQ